MQPHAPPPRTVVLTPYETRYVWERATHMMPTVGAHGLNKCLAHAIGEVLYARAGKPQLEIHEVPLPQGGVGHAFVDPATDEIHVVVDGHG